ncbi:outer membrane beta-barrel protein [Pontiellaceae bacterium B12219]|nr:outer membrane beta-barrel protein [Pontiellaceae bacterium B12219]
MTKSTLHVLAALSIVAGSSFAAKERVVRFQNQVRVGFDDNIYKTPDKTSSAFITDVINLSAKMNFSSRTDALLYWQPEFQYRFDADPKFITYQDLYARLNHAVSQRTFLTLSDRFRYQQKEGQTENPGAGGPSEYNQNYYENELLGAVDYTLNDVSGLRVGAGYEFRIWDDKTYGEWQGISGGTSDGGNNYNLVSADGSYYRQLKPNKTQVMAGVNYAGLAYEGDRGGYDAVTPMLGVDQNFTPNVTGFGRLGYSFTSVDNVGSSSDTSAPYLKAGVEVSPSARTSVTTSLGYSLYRSENSYYNAQDQLSLSLGVRHDITAKIMLSGAFNYIYSNYKSDYVTYGASLPDSKDSYISLGLRASYQLNRNNFLELGYIYQNRMVSSGSPLSEWDSNRVDCGWRLRL